MTLSYALDTVQGFTFTPGSRDSIGSLATATICGTALDADLTVTDPVTNASTAAVGVLTQVQWEETIQAPLSFTFLVSAHNRGVLEQILSQQIASATVILNFSVYQYASPTQKYYCAFTPEQPPQSVSTWTSPVPWHSGQAPRAATSSCETRPEATSRATSSPRPRRPPPYDSVERATATAP